MTSLKTAGGYIQEKWKDRGRERGKYKGKRGDTNRLIKIRTLKKGLRSNLVLWKSTRRQNPNKTST